MPDFIALRAQAIRLHPRRSNNTLPAGISKMGGNFLGQGAHDWPFCPNHQCPYVGVVQVVAEDFRPFEPFDRIPKVPFSDGTDLMQVCWCPHDLDDTDSLELRVLWRKVAEANQVEPRRLDIPETASQDLLPKECPFHPEVVLEYPSGAALTHYLENMLVSDPELQNLAREQENREGVEQPSLQRGERAEDRIRQSVLDYYRRGISTAPGTKLLGHPDWIQSPETPLCPMGHAMEHLLTIATCEWEKDDFRWQPTVRGTPDSLAETFNDADIMLGDAGNIYVFLCQRCQPWSVRSVLQCS